MRFLRDIPIQQKVTRVLLLACSVTVVTAVVGVFITQVLTLRQNLIRDISSLGQIIASQSTAAVTFDNPDDATEVLATLSFKSHITSASIILDNGNIFARYGVSDPDMIQQFVAEGQAFVFNNNFLLYAYPLMFDGEQIALLVLQSDYQMEFFNLVRLHAGILAAVLAMSILMAFLLASRLQNLISIPILQLARTARIIAENKDYSVRANPVEQDELGMLTHDFNQMLTQIQHQDSTLHQVQDELETQVEILQNEIQERKKAEANVISLNHQLVETSRQAGMAEVAASVLHNVGNVLNSINVSTTLIHDRIRRTRTANLSKLAALLQEHESNLGTFITEDPQGRFIPEYLIKLSDNIHTEQQNLLMEVDILVKNINHIKKIIRMQQTYAKSEGVIAEVQIDEVIEDALQMTEEMFRNNGIEVVKDYKEIPPVMIDQYKTLQIIINLLSNAYEALRICSQTEKTVMIRIQINENEIHIHISDNGIGISKENLTRIFAYGFTTREEGNGFGLHGGALAAREMGGSLTASSEGPGYGASFLLILPLKKEHDIHDGAIRDGASTQHAYPDH